MKEDKNTGQITDQLNHVFVVVLLTPVEHVADEIRLRTQEHSLQPTAIIEGNLFAFDTHEKLQQWLDAVDGLLIRARIRYIQARLVDPVFGFCTQKEHQALTDLGLISYCEIIPDARAETK